MISIANNNVESADRLLRNLSQDGFFGKESKWLNAIRDRVDTTTYIYESALSIVNTDYGDNKVIYQISNLLLLIYVDAMKIDGQRLKCILVSFIEGTDEVPSSENLTSYKNYIVEKAKLDESIKELSASQSINLADKMTLGNDFAAHYSSAVEFVSKILVSLIQIDSLIGKKDVKLARIEGMSTAEKLNYLRKSKNYDWNFIVNMVNKNVRNAESHLNFSYNPESERFIGKYFHRKRGKYVELSISAEEFIGKTLKGVEAVILGYILSNFMLYLSAEDRYKAMEIVNLMDKELDS